VLEAGANAIVAGSAVVNASDDAEGIEGIRNSKRSEPELVTAYILRHTLWGTAALYVQTL
jgi:hypothetical protein